MTHAVQWLTPSPLWNELAPLADKSQFRRPVILRFTADTFMEDLATLLSRQPQEMRAYVARPETWRSPAVGLAADGEAQAGKPARFKLYQPAQARFYLVSASLSCRLAGLPDHRIRRNKGEAVSFVVRRITPKDASAADLTVFQPEKFDEHAWVDPEQAPRWVKADRPGLMPGEERLPMFPTEYDDGVHRRRIFSGLIPVSRRQEYVAGREGKPKAAEAPPEAPPEDPRKIELQRMVVEPWALLAEWHQQTSAQPGFDAANLAESSRQSSAFILLDFAEYLQTYLPAVFDALKGLVPRLSLGLKQRELYDALSASDPSVGLTLRQAIVHADGYRQALELSTVASGLPAGYLPFRLTQPAARALIEPAGAARRPIERAIEDALPPQPKEAAPFRLPSRTPANAQGDDWYIVRCVFERPQCGQKAPAVLSGATRPFQLASFFDSDAPARSLQVALPVDTTPANLRKFDKNVAFMISDELNRQLARVKGMKDLMDGKLGAPGLDLGWICSLSIPIITLCAFFLLMIMVRLLNIIFWWLPFFKICFPLPKLKAKG